MPSGWRGFLQRHGFTFAAFSSIGAFVFVFGIAGLYVQVHWLGIGPQMAFLIQAFLSIELNYFLNWKLTWRKRQSKWWISFRRFHATRLVTIPANQLVYFLLIQLGVQYLLAALVTTAILTVLSYWFSDSWVFPGDLSTVDLEEEA